MSKKNLVVDAVQSVVAVDAFDAVMAEQVADIQKSADMLVSVERWESDAETAQAGIGAILHDVLMSQGELKLGWFDAVRLAWCDAYGLARGASVSDDAKRKAWSRVFKLTALDKPKSDNAESQAKAEKREQAKAQQNKLEADLAGLSVSDIKELAKQKYLEAADTAMDNPSQAKAKSDEAKRLAQIADKKIKEAVKSAKDEAKNLKASIRTALTGCNNVAVLGEVLMMLQGAFDDAFDGDDDTADLFQQFSITQPAFGLAFFCLALVARECRQGTGQEILRYTVVRFCGIGVPTRFSTQVIDFKAITKFFHADNVTSVSLSP